MIGRARVGAVLAVLAMSGPAWGADWPSIQGTERGRADEPAHVWGFVQVLGESIFGDPVTGLTNPNLEAYNGRLASFNVLGGAETQESFSVRRLRLGLRGSIPKTEQRVAYFVAAEYGQNSITEASPARLLDASVSFDLHEALAVRVGQFKLPIADETLESNPNTADLVNLSNVVVGLLHERRVAAGEVLPGANGTRDIGVQLFGAPRFGDVELSWAAMVSNGAMGGADPDPDKDLTGRLQVAWLLDDKPLGIERDELAVYAWGSTGGRHPREDLRVQRTRYGAGAQWRWRHRWRLRAEYIQASDALILGGKPPFPGAPRAYSAQGDAWGATALLGYRPIAELELNLGLNRLHTLPDGGADERIAWEEVAGVQYFVHPNAKIMLNGALRQTDAPQGNPDTLAILDTLGPRLSLQVTANF